MLFFHNTHMTSHFRTPMRREVGHHKNLICEIMGLTGLFRKNKTNTAPLSKIRLLMVGDISAVML